MRELERITARPSEPDTPAAELAKQLQEGQAEREELVIAWAKKPSPTGRAGGAVVA